MIYSLGTPLRVLDDGLDQALKAQAGRTVLDEPTTARLVRTWLTSSAYHAFQPDLAIVTDADDRRRYEVKLDIPVRTPDGAVICAYVVRPRAAERPPAPLNFTICADRAVNLDKARITAAHGYAAVEGFTRGKACSPQAPIPMNHDGADADAMIDWIAAQPWSNGKVGMYGGSYEGFTQCAAAKHPPKALKALITRASSAPSAPSARPLRGDGRECLESAHSIASLSDKLRRFYLSPGGPVTHRLTATPENGIISQTVDLVDRRDIGSFAPDGPLVDNSGDDWPIVTRAVNLPNSPVFVSAPLNRASELSGLFSARLDLATSKKDFDIAITLFELTPKGEYIQLSYIWQRASYAKDRSRRQLLTPGQRTTLRFQAGRLTSRQFEPGSRLLVALNVIKQPGEQINYGTGEDVSEETIALAGAPLQITWFADSYVGAPFVHHAASSPN